MHQNVVVLFPEKQQTPAQEKKPLLHKTPYKIGHVEKNSLEEDILRDLGALPRSYLKDET